jgi:hypothetical protein
MARNLSTSLVGMTTVHPAINDFTAPRLTIASISLVLIPSRVAASFMVSTPIASLIGGGGTGAFVVGTNLAT